jgi:hypothetical protein
MQNKLCDFDVNLEVLVVQKDSSVKKKSNVDDNNQSLSWVLVHVHD